VIIESPVDEDGLLVSAALNVKLDAAGSRQAQGWDAELVCPFIPDVPRFLPRRVRVACLGTGVCGSDSARHVVIDLVIATTGGRYWVKAVSETFMCGPP
jgi:hypothetical protein